MPRGSSHFLIVVATFLLCFATYSAVLAQETHRVYLPGLQNGKAMPSVPPSATPTATVTPPCDTLAGILTSSITLRSGCLYAITNNVLVDNGSRLTIEPGVTLRFDGKYYIAVDGILDASGSEVAPIRFTSGSDWPMRDDWAQLRFRSSSDVSRLSHVIVEYAGDYSLTQSPAAIFVEGQARLEIEDSIIQSNTVGISGSGIITISNSLLTENYAAIEYGEPGQLTVYSSTFAFNGPGVTLFAPDVASIKVYSSTIMNNHVEHTIPIISLDVNDVLQNSIVVSNTVRSGSIVVSAMDSATIRNNLFCNSKPHEDPLYPDFTRAIIGIVGLGEATVVLKDNNIQLPDSGYAVAISSYITSTIDGSYNYWFSTDEEEISSHIYDYYDDPLNRQVFQFMPIRTKPVVAALKVCPE